LVPVIIELSSSLRFVKKCNAYGLLAASLYLLLSGETRLGLEMYLFLAALIYFCLTMLGGPLCLVFANLHRFFHQPRINSNKRLNHLVFTEAATGKCFGVSFNEKHFKDGSSNGCKDVQGLTHNNKAYNWVLCEQNSKITPFGCWLAFENISQSQHLLPSWGARLHWVFVLKACVPIAQYKSLCRHLIWHRLSDK
jgi:hypothetical protein